MVETKSNGLGLGAADLRVYTCQVRAVMIGRALLRRLQTKLVAGPTSTRCLSGVFPREAEGNVYSVNWSLTEEGVVPKGDAFRNARVALLTSRLSTKVADGKVDVKSPAYTGKYEIVEAGDTISHDDFEALLEAQQGYLSSGIDLFVEDGAICASTADRLGVRVVTDSAASALIAKSMLISTPPREVDHRARFDGWNNDPRWKGDAEEGAFHGDRWVPDFTPGESARGQRPVVAFYGGAGNKVAVQFFASTENQDINIGATVSAGSDAPVRALVEAIGMASDVLINGRSSDSLSVPSVALTSGKVIIGADDSVVDAAVAKGSLYGAYNNVITPDGVSAGWNGVIGKAPAKAGSAHRFTVPSVVSGGKAAVTLTPDNMVGAGDIVFYEAGAGKKALSTEDAIKMIVDLTDDSKADLAAKLLSGKKCSVVGSAKDAIA